MAHVNVSALLCHEIHEFLHTTKFNTRMVCGARCRPYLGTFKHPEK